MATSHPAGHASPYSVKKLTTKAHGQNLIQLLLAHGLLPQDQNQGKHQQQQPMTKVTKHNGKQEGEGDNGEGGRVGLPVFGHTIGIHNLLEGVGDLVGLMVCGWRLVGD